MQDQQYDVDPNLLNLFRKKQQLRTAAKEFYRKMVDNPFRPINDGYLVDPALLKYQAMSSYHSELYKPSVTGVLKYFILVSPVLLIYYWFRKTHTEKEEKLRGGFVRYEDRVRIRF